MRQYEGEGPLTTVLVVDDIELTGQIVGVTLTAHGMDVDVKRSAPEAIEWLSSHSADVVLSDVRMPEMSGTELAKEIYVRFGSQRPGLIALTAYANVDERRSIFAAGFDGVIMKPASSQMLLNAIQKVVQKRGRFKAS